MTECESHFEAWECEYCGVGKRGLRYWFVYVCSSLAKDPA